MPPCCILIVRPWVRGELSDLSASVSDCVMGYSTLCAAHQPVTHQVGLWFVLFPENHIKVHIKHSPKQLFRCCGGWGCPVAGTQLPHLVFIFTPCSPKPAVWITCKESQNNFHASQEAPGSSHTSGWCTKNIFLGIFLRPYRPREQNSSLRAHKGHQVYF